MADDSSRGNATPDPFQLWRSWLDESERQWNSVLNEWMSSDEFGQVSGKVMEGMLALQASFNQATQRYFSLINLPTRTDLLSMSERLSGIEERLARIEASLEGLAVAKGSTTRGSSRSRPPRTKKAARTDSQ